MVAARWEHLQQRRQGSEEIGGINGKVEIAEVTHDFGQSLQTQRAHAAEALQLRLLARVFLVLLLALLLVVLVRFVVLASLLLHPLHEERQQNEVEVDVLLHLQRQVLDDVVQQRQHAHHVVHADRLLLLQQRHLRVDHGGGGGDREGVVVEEACGGELHELLQLAVLHRAEVGQHAGVAHGDRHLGVRATQETAVENARDDADHLAAVLPQNHALAGGEEEGGDALLELHVVAHHQQLVLVRLQTRRRRNALQRRVVAQDRHGLLLQLAVALREKVHQHIAQHGRAVAVLDQLAQVLEELQERLHAVRVLLVAHSRGERARSGVEDLVVAALVHQEGGVLARAGEEAVAEEEEEQVHEFLVELHEFGVDRRQAGHERVPQVGCVHRAAF